MNTLYVVAGIVAVVIAAMAMVRASAKSEGEDEAHRKAAEDAIKASHEAGLARARRRARGFELLRRMRARSGDRHT